MPFRPNLPHLSLPQDLKLFVFSLMSTNHECLALNESSRVTPRAIAVCRIDAEIRTTARSTSAVLVNSMLLLPQTRKYEKDTMMMMLIEEGGAWRMNESDRCFL